MSFRKIRPSSFGESSASTSNPTSESTGSDPRRIRSEKEIDHSSNTTASSKRRRVPESVTRNACVNCKKARAKCDAKQPCKRCASRLEASECIYEVHVKHAKEELVKQIKDLRSKDHLTEQILQAISSDEKVPEIIKRLKVGDTYESIVEWLVQNPVGGLETLSQKESSPRHSTIEVSDHEMSGVNPEARWTSVISDTAVLDHLFQLYFAWVHPVHTLFSEGHFVDSYKRQSDGYCSSVLVNSICAMACHLHSGNDSEDFGQLSTEFSDAVRANIDASDTKITTIQALAVMFLVDCARANVLRASSYLKLAIEGLPSVIYVESEDFHESWKNTIRGVRNLNVEWSQMTFQVPAIIEFTLPETYHGTNGEHDDANWYFYRYAGEQCAAWPSLLTTTNREKSKLIAIISDVATMMYSKHGPAVPANYVLRQYARFLAWRDKLPGIIGNVEDNNSQALPHVLSLLILYSNSVVQLLRPLLELDGFPTLLLEEVVWKHAQQGLSFLNEHYRTQYTCRYQPVLQMFGILHLVDVIARFFPGGAEGSGKDGPEAIQFGLEALFESRSGCSIPSPLQEMLRRTAQECFIRLPPNTSELIISPLKNNSYYMDDMIDACTRPSYVQPISEINSRFTQSFSTEWATQAPSLGFREPTTSNRRLRKPPSAEERGAQNLMQIRNLLNTS